MKIQFIWVTALYAFTLFSCAQEEALQAPVTLYMGHGDNILTMEGASPTYVECVVVSEGKIAFVGSKQAADEHYAQYDSTVQLGDRVLLPGFVDPHGHYASSLTVSNQVCVYPSPNGEGDSPSEIIRLIRESYDPQDRPDLLVAYGYDENEMPEGNQLNRDLLDDAFGDVPVVVSHISMHGGVLNTAALHQYGFDSTYTPSEGTSVQFEPGQTQGLPYGLIMEDDYMQKVFAELPAPTTAEEIKEATLAGQMMYAREGITLAHEGATLNKDLKVMVAAANYNMIDVVAHPFLLDLADIQKDFPVNTWGHYNNGLKIGAVKITLDGSPQGRTALFSEKYLTEDTYGTLVVAEDLLDSAMRGTLSQGIPLNVHTNGDSAINLFLDTYENVRQMAPDKPWNVTTIHTQFIRQDQLDRYLDYGIRPSFYTEHAFYFGETHIRNRGLAQAEFLSPMRKAIDMGMRPTNHTDFVVAPLDQMFVLWSAVTRVTRSGLKAYQAQEWDGQDPNAAPEGVVYVLGPDQRVSAYEGLLSQTLWAAEQYEEEDMRGSIAEEKLADFVILDRDPVALSNPMEILDLKVLYTIKEGRLIYDRSTDPTVED